MWHARAEKAKTSLCITTWGSLFLSCTLGNEKFRSNGRAPYAQKNLRVKKKRKPVGAKLAKNSTSLEGANVYMR
uniref:Putative secreted protein n=1 Tax=Ixodes ricinus TaxID=34613 RepID=A0A6B0TT50_IXORI